MAQWQHSYEVMNKFQQMSKTLVLIYGKKHR